MGCKTIIMDLWLFKSPLVLNHCWCREHFCCANFLNPLRAQSLALCYAWCYQHQRRVCSSICLLVFLPGIIAWTIVTSLLHSNSNCGISMLFHHHPLLSYSPTYHRQKCYKLIHYPILQEAQKRPIQYTLARSRHIDLPPLHHSQMRDCVHFNLVKTNG